jgi:arginase family protein
MKAGRCLSDSLDWSDFRTTPAPPFSEVLPKHHHSSARLLGGDHSITYPVLRGMRRSYPPPTILHIDAHPDLYDEFEGDRFSHACPFARILEEGLASRLVQVGIRTMNAHQRSQADRFGVEVIDMRTWEAGTRPAVDGDVYLSIDLDGLDPAYAPGVSHREPGGLSVRDVLTLVQGVKGTLVGADVVEYNPRQDVAGTTATVAAKIVKEIAGRMLLALLTIMTVLSPSLVAQDRSRVWLGLGLGGGGRADGASGIALMGEVVSQVRAHHFALRGLGVVDPLGEGADEFGEIGLLYGRAAKRAWGHGAIAAGLAITGVSSCSDAATSGCTTLGIPVVAEAALRLGSVIGVGAQGFTNLNTKSTYGGLLVFLQLGWLP